MTTAPTTILMRTRTMTTSIPNKTSQTAPGRVPSGRRSFPLGMRAIYLAAVGALALLASQVHQFPGEIDISLWVQSWRTQWLDGLMYAVSAPGLWQVATPIVALTAATLFFVGRRRESFLVASAVGSAAVANIVLKEMIARPRPPESVVEVFGSPSTFGFPSGHVMTYVVFLGLLVFLLTCRTRPSPWRTAAYGALTLALVAVGVSRMYLGVHTLGDVVGGYAFGAGVVLLSGVVWLRWIDADIQPAAETRAKPRLPS